MTPTLEQIEAEIPWLQTNKGRIVRFTLFGDDNWDAIDAEIAVLEAELTEAEIDEHAEENGWSEHVRRSAMDAAQWLASGEEGFRPSSQDNWGNLVK
jgi:hypothetical protein